MARGTVAIWYFYFNLVIDKRSARVICYHSGTADSAMLKCVKYTLTYEKNVSIFNSLYKIIYTP